MVETLVFQKGVFTIGFFAEKSILGGKSGKGTMELSNTTSTVLTSFKRHHLDDNDYSKSWLWFWGPLRSDISTSLVEN